MSLFRCPLCASPLEEGERGLRCPQGHCYDRASEGYVNLLLANQKNSQSPGDDKKMVAARREFLDRGWYSPLRDALADLAVRTTGEKPVVLDVGCGEGYYTAGILAALAAGGKSPSMAGIDISKFSIKKAAKRYKGVEFAVASAVKLPLADQTVDFLCNVFSPLELPELRRVIRPGGVFAYVVPGPLHLWELKEALYDEPYQNEEKETPYPGFTYQEIIPLDYEIYLPTGEDIQSLFQMTPYCWKTSTADKAKLQLLQELHCRISFRIHVFQRDKSYQFPLF